MSRSQLDNIFAQASLNKNVWELVQEVFSMFENGNLKGQKLSTKRGEKIQAPEFKQQYLQPIQCLPKEFQLDVLTKVVNKEVGLKDMKSLASDYRKLEVIRKCFCRLTNTASIEIAKEKFPNHASDESFYKFIHLDFKDTPSVFAAHCKSAIACRNAPNQMLQSVRNNDQTLHKLQSYCFSQLPRVTDSCIMIVMWTSLKEALFLEL